MTSGQPVTQRTFYLPALVLVLALGIWMRVYPSESFNQRGFDERLYNHYVSALNTVGVSGYPRIVTDYLDHQRNLTYSVLPPLRFMYIFVTHLWCRAAGTDISVALHDVATLFTILTLLVSYTFARRIKGKWFGLGVLALMSVAPAQIHMAQHALVDGVFAFWALLSLWLLWENLQQPNHPGWLSAWALSLACMVMTKENAFFAFVAMVAIVIANRWLRFGAVTPRLLAAMFLGPLLGVLSLVALAGGVHQTIDTYQQLVTKSYTLPYAVLTGDGPWQRYLSDLLLMSPVVLLLATGEFFQLKSDNKAGWFFTLFFAASYLVMCNIKYGMNLRYANMWDMPLHYMALCQIIRLGNHFGPKKNRVIAGLVVLVCLIELRQYEIFFVQHNVYELIAKDLLKAVNILK